MTKIGWHELRATRKQIRRLDLVLTGLKVSERFMLKRGLANTRMLRFWK